MCDTYVVMSDVSASGKTVLAKNSDRPSFDCQPLAYHSGKKFGKAESLKLAYVTIDQAEERCATVGSSPYWCWGYEEGLNEYGVAIGNEAVYTKDLSEYAEAEAMGASAEKGLLGMELLRLGLERGKTAAEALHVMTALIEQYGQWGSGVPMSDTVSGSYNNSFVIADRNEAYILETAGKRWAAKRIRKGYAAISNELSIRTDLTCHSQDLIDHAVEKGWWKEAERERFDFAWAYINQNNPRQVSHIRVQRVRQLLKQAVQEKGTVSTEWMKRILRDHYEDTFLEGPYFQASCPDFLTICMHESPACFTWGNTASSSLMVLPAKENGLPVMWWAPVVPCCSVYIPVFVDAGKLPECLMRAGTFGKTMCAPSDVKEEDTYREGSLWWEMRSLLDQVNDDAFGNAYEEKHRIVRTHFDELEEKWTKEILAVETQAAALKKSGKIEEMRELLSRFTARCAQETLEVIQQLKELL